MFSLSWLLLTPPAVPLHVPQHQELHIFGLKALPDPPLLHYGLQLVSQTLIPAFFKSVHKFHVNIKPVDRRNTLGISV